MRSEKRFFKLPPPSVNGKIILITKKLFQRALSNGFGSSLRSELGGICRCGNLSSLLGFGWSIVSSFYEFYRFICRYDSPAFLFLHLPEKKKKHFAKCFA